MRNYQTAAIYNSNPNFHLISRVCLPPRITCGTYNVTFSLFITDPFSNHTDSLSSAPGGYSGDSKQSGNHVSTQGKSFQKRLNHLISSLMSDEKSAL